MPSVKMPSVKPQAISGVSAGIENTIMTKYPSIACRGIGRFLGGLYESIPAPTCNGIKPSHVLFVLPTAVFGVLGYILLKITGERYELTNQSVRKWKSLGSQLISEVPLTDIDQIEVHQSPGQVFFKAADLHLLNAAGQTILRIEGMPRAEVFRQNILEARDARNEVAASLAAINARHPA